MKSQALHTLGIRPVWAKYKRLKGFYFNRERGVMQFLDMSLMQLLQTCRLHLRNGVLWLVGWCILWGLPKVQVTHACFYDNFSPIPWISVLLYFYTDHDHPVPRGGERTASPCTQPLQHCWIWACPSASIRLGPLKLICSLKLNWMLQIKQTIWWRVH